MFFFIFFILSFFVKSLYPFCWSWVFTIRCAVSTEVTPPPLSELVVAKGKTGQVEPHKPPPPRRRRR